MVSYKKDISTKGAKLGQGDQYKDNLDTDVLIVGAGFGGIYLLHRLRDELGLNVKVYEAGTDLGGIWHWNCYPGARVDSPIPVYEYAIPEIYKTWSWSCRYPGYAELRKYFDHVDKTLGIRKDVAFNTRAVDSQWNEQTKKWTVKTEDGRTATANFLIVAAGFAAKRHIPDWPGLEKFKGVIHHSSFWPNDGVDVSKSKIAVIGTGATGIQLSQDLSKQAKHLTVFIRTPNLCLPMAQEPTSVASQDGQRGGYAEYFKHRRTTFAGFPYDFADRDTMDDTPEQRQAFFDDLYQKGGFNFWLATYRDMLFDKDANEEAYRYWYKRTASRITDPKKRAILAPEKKLHYFGTKRPSLEQDYYESMDRPNVTVADISGDNPISEITEKGIKTKDGTEYELDMIALATGFDAVSGGMKGMGLKDSKGVDLAEKWSGSVHSYLGTTIQGYPNMFYLYGVHGPTAFSNGPTCVEVQGDWIFDAIKKMRAEGIRTLEPTVEAEKEWHQKVQDLSNKTLFPYTKSWYMGANIPGKKVEQLNYAGGFPLYQQELWATLPEWKGFTTAK